MSCAAGVPPCRCERIKQRSQLTTNGPHIAYQVPAETPLPRYSLLVERAATHAGEAAAAGAQSQSKEIRPMMLGQGDPHFQGSSVVIGGRLQPVGDEIS